MQENALGIEWRIYVESAAITLHLSLLSLERIPLTHFAQFLHFEDFQAALISSQKQIVRR